MKKNDTTAVELATELTVAWLSNPSTRASCDSVPAFLMKMSETVSGLLEVQTAAAPVEELEEYTPAVSARMSLSSPDHINASNSGTRGLKSSACRRSPGQAM